MLDEVDRREAAVTDVAALEQQQRNGQTSSSRKAKKPRRWWVRPWLTEHEREKKRPILISQASEARVSITDRQSFHPAFL